MIINASKTRDPIAVWYLKEDDNESSTVPLSNIQDITLGWDEFRDKLKKEGLSLSYITDNRWKPACGQHIYHDFGRKKLSIGKYIVLDGMHSLKHKINGNNNIVSSNLHIMASDGILFFGNSDISEKKEQIFFNAPDKYRDNILNGSQPLRTTTHYRNTNGHSSDSLEGVISKESLHTKNIKYIYLETLPNEAYIFSLHNNPKGIEKFGSDLFLVKDINEFVKEIYTQVDDY